MIDIIIPVYNGEKFIAQAIESILNQTFNDFTVIIVDDGSQDSTVEEIERYMKNDSRIVLFKNPHQGQPKTINKGLLETSNTYICFLDADDLWLPTKLERQIDFLENNTQTDVLFTMIQEFEDFDKGTLQKYDARPHPMKGVQKSTIMFRSTLLDQFGLFDENQYMAVFINWYRQLIRQGVQEHILDKVLVKRRVHDSNFTKTINRKDYLKVIKKHLMTKS